jgi:dienelactone hydrolase
MGDTLGGTTAKARATRGGRKRLRLRAALFSIAALVVLLTRPASHHVRAAELLMSFSDPSDQHEEILTWSGMLETNDGSLVPTRTYAPPGATRETPALVLVHGVHRLGIEEPRLQRFARAVASAGIVVLTPEIVELSDYQVAPRSIDTVGAACKSLRAKTGRRVGLMGMSFGGGVSMLAAADPRFADDVAFVAAVGAHDDLGRVSHFFATNEVETVSGETKAMRAHEYGATVLVYTHVEDFFPAADVPAARDALRLWLWEERDDAREAEKGLSPASKAKVDALFASPADIASVRPEILAEIDRNAEAMQAVSPHGRLGGMKAHVYLLHGEGDTVIPSTETLWLAHDVPKETLRDVLVSLGDRARLVHFMSDLIDEAEDER